MVRSLYHWHHFVTKVYKPGLTIRIIRLNKMTYSLAFQIPPAISLVDNSAIYPIANVGFYLRADMSRIRRPMRFYMTTCRYDWLIKSLAGFSTSRNFDRTAGRSGCRFCWPFAFVPFRQFTVIVFVYRYANLFNIEQFPVWLFKLSLL